MGEKDCGKCERVAGGRVKGVMSSGSLCPERQSLKKSKQRNGNFVYHLNSDLCLPECSSLIYL